jgi:hypothetical protein
MGGTKAITVYLRNRIYFLRITIYCSYPFQPVGFRFSPFLWQHDWICQCHSGFLYASVYLFSGGRERCIPHSPLLIKPFFLFQTFFLLLEHFKYLYWYTLFIYFLLIVFLLWITRKVYAMKRIYVPVPIN